MARRSKYTDEVTKPLLDAISSGMTDGDACAVVGIAESTFYHWQNTKPDFLDRVTRARPSGWLSALNVIKQEAHSGDWRAAAEFLDRTHSPYRKSQDVNVNLVIRKKAEQLAEQLGVPVDDVIAEAEAVAAGSWDAWQPA